MATLHMKDSRDYLALRVRELQDELLERDPSVLAANTGSIYTGHNSTKGEFRLRLWDREIRLTWPDFQGYDIQRCRL